MNVSLHSSTLLGIHLDTNLSWLYINSSTSKASKRLYFLKQLKRAGVPYKQLLHFYTAVIGPVLEYAAPAWHHLINAQTPLIRFVVDLLYNKLYNKSTTNRSPTTNPQQIEAMEFGFHLLWTCCSVAANHRADVDDVLKLRIT